MDFATVTHFVTPKAKSCADEIFPTPCVNVNKTPIILGCGLVAGALGLGGWIAYRPASDDLANRAAPPTRSALRTGHPASLGGGTTKKLPANLEAICRRSQPLADKLTALQNDFPVSTAIPLWLALLAQQDSIRSGQLPGVEDWQAAVIFNDLLDRLVAAGSDENLNVGSETSAAIASIFQRLISADTTEALLQDYSIQRGLIWASAAPLTDATARATVIDAVLARLDSKHLQGSGLGTSLNTFWGFAPQWSPAEKSKIHARITQLIAELPANQESLALEVRIPLLTAIGAWGVEAGLPQLTAALDSGRPALQIPAIAAWSLLPPALRGGPREQQVHSLAASTSPLQYAASAALTRTQNLPSVLPTSENKR